VDEVPPKYICSICMKVLRKARLAECCGQHYCDSCLAQWFRSNPQKNVPPLSKYELSKRIEQGEDPRN
jgi:hypothetical protein